MYVSFNMNILSSTYSRVNKNLSTYVATQWAAVTTHRLFRRAPPHDNFFDKNPDLMIAAFILNTNLITINMNNNNEYKLCLPAMDVYRNLIHDHQRFDDFLHIVLHNLIK